MARCPSDGIQDILSCIENGIYQRLPRKFQSCPDDNSFDLICDSLNNAYLHLICNDCNSILSPKTHLGSCRRHKQRCIRKRQLVEIRKNDVQHESFSSKAICNYKHSLVNGEYRYAELRALIDLTCRTIERFEKQTTKNHKVLYQLIQNINIFGLGESFLHCDILKRFHEIILRHVYDLIYQYSFPVLPNIFFFLKDFEQIIKNRDKEIWRKAMFLPDLFVHRETHSIHDIAKFYTWKVFSTVDSIYHAVLDEDWESVQRIITEIDLAWCEGPYAHRYFNYTKVGYSLNFSQIFYAALQRLIQCDCSTDVIATRLVSMAHKFSITNWTNSNLVRKTPEFYLCEVLIFMITRELLTESVIMKEIRLLPLSEDLEYSNTLRIYNLVGDYLRWNKDGCMDDMKATELQRYFFYFVEGANDPYKYLMLFTPFVHLSKIVGVMEETVKLLREICVRTPWMLPFVCKILMEFGLDDFSGKLVEEILPSHQSLFQDRLLIKYIKPRLESPKSFGNTRKVIKENICHLLTYLDYGRNRMDENAWRSLETNLQMIDETPRWLCKMWEERKTWWPKFNSSQRRAKMSVEAEKARKNVMKMLENFNENNNG